VNLMRYLTKYQVYLSHGFFIGNGVLHQTISCCEDTSHVENNFDFVGHCIVLYKMCKMKKENENMC